MIIEPSPVSHTCHGFCAFVSENIDKQKRRALSTIFPEDMSYPTCTLLLFTNPAESEWISVNCTKKLLSQVFCDVPTRRQKANGLQQGLEKYKTCSKDQVLYTNKCFLFLWLPKEQNQNKSLSAVCHGHHMNAISKFVMRKWTFLILAIQPSFSSVLIKRKESVVQITFRKFLYLLRFKSVVVSQSHAEGFVICEEARKLSKTVFPHVWFSCQRGGFISNKFLCDGLIDCPNDNDDDETTVLCRQQFHNMVDTDPTQQREATLKGYRKCASLFFSSVKGVCEPFFVTTNKTSPSPNESGKMGQCFLDREYSNETGNHQFIVSLLVRRNFTVCPHPHQLPCGIGHTCCFRVTDTCIYKLHRNKQLKPCSNGGHLETCKTFECNLRFKCRLSHCVSWEYVCDGKWDCPEGDDESYQPICGESNVCVNMFVCRAGTRVCIHLSNVCDGEQNCPFSDDEHLCDLQSLTCPESCVCFLYAIECKISQLVFDQKLSPMLSIVVSDGKLSNVAKMVSYFPRALQLILSRNAIALACGISFPSTVVLLDLEWNTLQYLSKHCFCSVPELRAVKLGNNKIKVVSPMSFANLSQLRELSLSNNPVAILHANMVQRSGHLKILSIYSINFEEIEINPFAEMGVQVINTTDYHVCCVAQTNSFCTAKILWFKTCSDLLPAVKIKLVYWVVSCLIVVFSSVSAVAHFLTWKQNPVFAITVTSINVDDGLCGLYLFVIWVTDIVFQETFFVQEVWWRSSIMCFFALFCLLWFTILTQLLLSFLSLSRLSIVIHPVESRFKRTKPVIASIASIYFLSGLASLVLASVIKLMEGTVQTNLCLPFVDPTHSSWVISVLTWSLAISQFLTSVAIVGMHSCLVHKVLESQQALRKSKSEDNVSLVVQLFVISFSNILCWLPVNAIYISAMFLTIYPVDMVSWSTVLGIPVNSLINPSVFIVTCLRKHVKSRKMPGVRGRFTKSYFFCAKEDDPS